MAVSAAAIRAAKNKLAAEQRLTDLRRTASQLRRKADELNLQQRAQRAVSTGGAVGGGATAAILDYELGSMELFGVEIPMSAPVGIALRIGAEVIDDGKSMAAGAISAYSDGIIAGATYRLVGEKYADWRA